MDKITKMYTELKAEFDAINPVISLPGRDGTMELKINISKPERYHSTLYTHLYRVDIFDEFGLYYQEIILNTDTGVYSGQFNKHVKGTDANNFSRICIDAYTSWVNSVAKMSR